ncbi:Rv3235 family protein [Luteococcus sp. H138]|uniref:Rv3235 family protein n=1 Tax=unclassified Luteococcus TaxID=2639923 RepID=UPI00313EAFEE
MNRPTQLTLQGQKIWLMVPPLPHGDLPRLAQAPLPTALERDPLLRCSPADSDPAKDDGQAEANRLVASISRSLLEVLQRRRSPAQLAMWMDEPCHLLLVAWSRQRDWLATRILTVRACRVAATVVEGTALLHDAQRAFPVLLRLEQRYGRWHVTVFEVMVPPAAGSRLSSCRGSA